MGPGWATTQGRPKLATWAGPILRFYLFVLFCSVCSSVCAASTAAALILRQTSSLIQRDLMISNDEETYNLDDNNISLYYNFKVNKVAIVVVAAPVVVFFVPAILSWTRTPLHLPRVILIDMTPPLIQGLPHMPFFDFCCCSLALDFSSPVGGP